MESEQKQRISALLDSLEEGKTIGRFTVTNAAIKYSISERSIQLDAIVDAITSPYRNGNSPFSTSLMYDLMVLFRPKKVNNVFAGYGERELAATIADCTVNSTDTSSIAILSAKAVLEAFGYASKARLTTAEGVPCDVAIISPPYGDKERYRTDAASKFNVEDLMNIVSLSHITLVYIGESRQTHEVISLLHKSCAAIEVGKATVFVMAKESFITFVENTRESLYHGFDLLPAVAPSRAALKLVSIIEDYHVDASQILELGYAPGALAVRAREKGWGYIGVEFRGDTKLENEVKTRETNFLQFGATGSIFEMHTLMELLKFKGSLFISDLYLAGESADANYDLFVLSCLYAELLEFHSAIIKCTGRSTEHLIPITHYLRARWQRVNVVKPPGSAPNKPEMYYVLQAKHRTRNHYLFYAISLLLKPRVLVPTPLPSAHYEMPYLFEASSIAVMGSYPPRFVVNAPGGRRIPLSYQMRPAVHDIIVRSDYMNKKSIDVWADERKYYTRGRGADLIYVDGANRREFRDKRTRIGSSFDSKFVYDRVYQASVLKGLPYVPISYTKQDENEAPADMWYIVKEKGSYAGSGISFSRGLRGLRNEVAQVYIKPKLVEGRVNHYRIHWVVITKGDDIILSYLAPFVRHAFANKPWDGSMTKDTATSHLGDYNPDAYTWDRFKEIVGNRADEVIECMRELAPRVRKLFLTYPNHEMGFEILGCDFLMPEDASIPAQLLEINGKIGLISAKDSPLNASFITQSVLTVISAVANMTMPLSSIKIGSGKGYEVKVAYFCPVVDIVDAGAVKAVIPAYFFHWPKGEEPTFSRSWLYSIITEITPNIQPYSPGRYRVVVAFAYDKSRCSIVDVIKYDFRDSEGNEIKENKKWYGVPEALPKSLVEERLAHLILAMAGREYAPITGFELVLLNTIPDHVRGVFFHGKDLTLDEVRAITVNRVVVGHLAVYGFMKGDVSLGIHIIPEYRRRGYASKAIDVFMSMYPEFKFKAYVNQKNEASLSLFSKKRKVELITVE
jgi:23S rRNA U2552 (ribose-2'-O)-methylase RlmE/FtsJ